MPELGPDAQTFLIVWARTALRAHLQGQSPEPGPLPPEALVPGGCFVSLHTSEGQLRGCIGSFESNRPLWQVVQDMAVACGTRDPRFRPVSLEDLDDLVFEISALSVLQPAQPADVIVGRHGVQIENGWHRGVLLPQVATEQGWDRDTFLEHTCLKAGLPKDAWRDGSTRLQVFSAQVISEDVLLPTRPKAPTAA